MTQAPVRPGGSTGATEEAAARATDGATDGSAVAALAVARRIKAGAALRVLPGAAEVLPAQVLAAGDPVEAARAGCRPDDVLVLAGPAGDPVTAELAVRAAVWGVTCVWVGSGPRPPAGAADHVLWGEDPAGVLDRLAGQVREHLADPALLPATPSGVVCTDEVCITCSDEGRPAEVLQPPDGPFGEALVRTATGEERIDVTLVGPVQPGDLVLVHAGSALTLIDLTGGVR